MFRLAGIDHRIGAGLLGRALMRRRRLARASVLSWILAAGMLSLLALTYAELGATYPVAGRRRQVFPITHTVRLPDFTSGWGVVGLQAVFIAPIEVLAAITYVNSVWLGQSALQHDL